MKNEYLIMNTWAARIKSRMKELGMTQDMLAKQMAITRGAITHYLSGRREPPLRQFQKLATILQTDPAWLQFGVTTQSNHEKQSEIEKLSYHELMKANVPFLSWEQVATIAGCLTQSSQTSNTQYLPHIYTDQSQWYALLIDNDVMTAVTGYSPSFPKGSMIIIDPNKALSHGSYVIALLPYAKEVTFKQYVVDGGVQYLKPLNPQYPLVPMDKGTCICGVVIMSINSF
jgi:SOS-response transcriptional repressor LexA